MSKSADMEQTDDDRPDVTTTIDIDDRGRGTVPQKARQALGVDGVDATLEVTIERVITVAARDDGGDGVE